MSDSSYRSRRPKRAKTKELLAVAGLTAAEYSTSYAVQEYLGKTIQNASSQSPRTRDTTTSNNNSNNYDAHAGRCSSRLQKAEQKAPRRSSVAGHEEMQRQRRRAHRQEHVYQKTPSSSRDRASMSAMMGRQLPESQHASTGRLMAGTQHSSLSQLSLVEDDEEEEEGPPTPRVIFRDAGEEKEQYALFMRMQKDNGQQAARRIDRAKLGRRHEALGSHPPFVMEVEDWSAGSGSGTVVPGRSTGTGEEGR